MSGKPLDGGHVGSGLQEIANERAAQVVGRERWHSGLRRPTTQHHQHRLIRHAPVDQGRPRPSAGQNNGPGSGPRVASQASSASFAPFAM